MRRLNIFIQISMIILLESDTIRLTQDRHLELYIHRFGHTQSWWLFFHSSYDLITGYAWNGWEMRNNFYYSMTYTSSFYQLLESPYPTDCENYYLSSKYISRKECLRKCKIKVSLQICGSISKDISVYSGEKGVLFANTSGENCADRINFWEQCLKVCPKVDCFLQYYRTTKSSEYPGKLVDNYTRIDITTPVEPDTTFFHKPKIELIEFLCYLASTLSVWFGFSLITIMDLAILLEKFYSGKKNKEKLNKIETRTIEVTYRSRMFY